MILIYISQLQILFIKNLTFIVINQKMLLHLTKIVKLRCFILKTTGETLRESREKKGMLLRHLSATLEIDTAILSKIERGERKATREQINKLAEILEIDKEYLMIQFLSERILYELRNEDLGIKALKVAENAIKYGGIKNK